MNEIQEIINLYDFSIRNKNTINDFSEKLNLVYENLKIIMSEHEPSLDYMLFYNFIKSKKIKKLETIPIEANETTKNEIIFQKLFLKEAIELLNSKEPIDKNKFRLLFKINVPILEIKIHINDENQEIFESLEDFEKRITFKNQNILILNTFKKIKTIRPDNIEIENLAVNLTDKTIRPNNMSIEIENLAVNLTEIKNIYSNFGYTIENLTTKRFTNYTKTKEKKLIVINNGIVYDSYLDKILIIFKNYIQSNYKTKYETEFGLDHALFIQNLVCKEEINYLMSENFTKEKTNNLSNLYNLIKLNTFTKNISGKALNEIKNNIIITNGRIEKLCEDLNTMYDKIGNLSMKLKFLSELDVDKKFDLTDIITQWKANNFIDSFDILQTTNNENTILLKFNALKAVYTDFTNAGNILHPKLEIEKQIIEKLKTGQYNLVILPFNLTLYINLNPSEPNRYFDFSFSGNQFINLELSNPHFIYNHQRGCRGSFAQAFNKANSQLNLKAFCTYLLQFLQSLNLFDYAGMSGLKNGVIVDENDKYIYSFKNHKKLDGFHLSETLSHLNEILY